MATRTDASLHCDNSTDANFRAWAQFIEDTLVTTGGWVVTADTGQMTISTSTHPAAINTKVGYRIYRMADTLQATAPVFIRIDYGSGNSAATHPAVWVTIGTGSNGSGTITGVVYNGGAVAAAKQICPVAVDTTNILNSYGSADTNRASIMLFCTSTGDKVLFFDIQRTKDSSGADTATGLIWCWKIGVTLLRAQYLPFSGAIPIEECWSYVLGSGNGAAAASAFGTDVGVGVLIPIKGYAQLPGYGPIIVRTGDFAAEASLTMSTYGNSHTYQTCNVGLVNSAVAFGASDTGTRFGIRFD